MKRKRYIKPITTAVAAESSTILAGSGNTGEPSIPSGDPDDNGGKSPGEAEAKPFSGFSEFSSFNEAGKEDSSNVGDWQNW